MCGQSNCGGNRLGQMVCNMANYGLRLNSSLLVRRHCLESGIIPESVGWGRISNFPSKEVIDMDKLTCFIAAFVMLGSEDNQQ